MPARDKELSIGIGFKRQTNTGELVTTAAEVQAALTAGSLWGLGIGSFSVPFPEFDQEDDAEFYGKGDEFVTQVFPKSLATNFAWDFHLTSQNWAQVICFALGNIAESTPGAGATQYLVTVKDTTVTGVNLPATTIVAAVRPGASEILDIASVGMVCSGFTLKLSSGPGLQNSQLTSQWVGCGKFVNNSGIAIPAATTEQRLGAGLATALTINGVNYFTNSRFVELEFNYQNNPTPGYYPGSGQQSGFDIAGRMRMGSRTATLVWQVELESTSTELADLIAGTEGTATITLEGPIITGAIKHTAEIVLHRVRHKVYQIQASPEGFITARVETSIMKHASNGVMTLKAITTQALIGSEA